MPSSACMLDCLLSSLPALEPPGLIRMPSTHYLRKVTDGHAHMTYWLLGLLQAPGNEITSPHRAWLRLNAPKCLHAWLLAFLLACHRTPRTHWNAEYSLFEKSHRWTRTHDTLTPWAPVRAKNCHDTWRSDLAGLRVSCLHLAALAAPSPGVTPPHLWSLEAATVSR